jgi:hypothetical protein
MEINMRSINLIKIDFSLNILQHSNKDKGELIVSV